MEGGGFLGLEIERERGQRHKVQFGQSGILVDFAVSASQICIYTMLHSLCIIYTLYIIYVG